MNQIFKCFWGPVPSNWGHRERPQHEPSQQNRNRVNTLVALGWDNARIAAALFVAQPTLRRHYFSEVLCDA
jgi:Holliday junction resolvasome RuvABC DNA-binding subunit